ncbi:MAG: helix-turn-helix domain-containing protein, partial [Blastocatellia bacterium]
FGDRKQPTNCRCSNCQPQMKWKEIEEAVEERHQRVNKSNASAEPIETGGARALTDEEHLVVRKILSCVARMNGKFGKGLVAGVLRGSRAKNIQANNLDQLSTHGLLRDYTQDELTRFINALIVAGCIRQSGTVYPLVSLTDLGRQVMLDKARVELDPEAVAADLSDEVSEESAVAEIEKQLHNQLGDTHEKTFALYRAGLSIAQIAEHRELKSSTIEEHLSQLIADGRAVNLEDLVAPADRELIEVAIESCAQAGQVGLKPIKEALPERISYGAIRLVSATLRRRQKS